MAAKSQHNSYSWDEVFMALLLFVLIPVMLLGANIDLRSQVGLILHQFSSSDGIRFRLDDLDLEQAAKQGDATAARAVSLAPATQEPTGRDPEKPISGSEALPKTETRLLSLMPVDFSLDELDSLKLRQRSDVDGQLTVNKPIYAGTDLIGNIDITIAGEGNLLLDAEAVRTIMGQQAIGKAQASSRLPDQGLVSFAALRDLGVDLRYFPNEDIIRFNP
jgi:hypothetical protein